VLRRMMCLASRGSSTIEPASLDRSSTLVTFEW
jgi:hypothetical protein